MSWLRTRNVEFKLHPYLYQPRGGAAWAARASGLEPHAVIKTLVMQDAQAKPLVALMHGDREVSAKRLARAIGAKHVQTCTPEVAQRHTGYQVGGISPFALRKVMPVYLEASVLEVAHIYVNGGRRGLLIRLESSLVHSLLHAHLVSCALPTECGP